MKPRDFADLEAIFRKALDLVGKGADVREALDMSLRQLHPFTYADLSRRVDEVFSSLKRETGWGDLRTLRELASGKTSLRMHGSSLNNEGPGPKERGELAADLQRVFLVAQTKCRAGYDPLSALDMASVELYPLIHRKVFQAASAKLRECMEKEGISPRSALRRLCGGDH